MNSLSLIDPLKLFKDLRVGSALNVRRVRRRDSRRRSLWPLRGHHRSRPRVSIGLWPWTCPDSLCKRAFWFISLYYSFRVTLPCLSSATSSIISLSFSPSPSPCLVGAGGVGLGRGRLRRSSGVPRARRLGTPSRQEPRRRG